ncbi:hypothetical protein AB0M96_17945, partial [Streptomyces sp. NPDC051098]
KGKMIAYYGRIDFNGIGHGRLDTGSTPVPPGVPTPTAAVAPSTPPPGFGPAPQNPAYGYPNAQASHLQAPHQQSAHTPPPQQQHPQTPPPHAQPTHQQAAHQQGPGTAPTPQYGYPPHQYTIGGPTGHLTPAPAKKNTGRNLAIAVVATVVLGALVGGGVFLALSGEEDGKDKASQSQDKGEDKGDQGPATGDPSDTAPETGGDKSSEPVKDPEPKTYTGLNVVDGYHITLGDEPVKPVADDASNSDVSYSWDLGWIQVENAKLILLRTGQAADLDTCRSETRYASRLETENLSKGAKFCVLTESGNVGVVTYQGKAPDSDPSRFITLDVTVWRGAIDPVQPTS